MEYIKPYFIIDRSDAGLYLRAFYQYVTDVLLFFTFYLFFFPFG